MLRHTSGNRLRAWLPAGGAPAFLRIAPVDANTFYVVTNAEDGVRSIRFNRNVGASASASDLGGIHPETRVTGLYGLAGFNDDPTAPSVTYANDVGAYDVVGNPDATGAGQFYGSYHGLGTGALDSEVVTVDGVAVDPYTDTVAGANIEIRNVTTATNGTNVLTRDLTTTINAQGGVSYTLNSLSQTGMGLVYAGMAIGSGNDYTEARLRVGTNFTLASLGASDCNGLFYGTREVYLRNPTTGQYVTVLGAMPDVSGFVRAEVKKLTANTRSKSYLGNFNSFAGLSNVAWDMNFGTGASGAGSLAANLIPSPDFSTTFTNPTIGQGFTRVVGTGASINIAAGVATLNQGTGNCRLHAPINGCVAGNWYMIASDILAAPVNKFAMMASSNTNSSDTTPPPAISQQVTQAQRQVYVFQATQTDPSQRLMFRIATGAEAYSAQVQNPYACAMAS